MSAWILASSLVLSGVLGSAELEARELARRAENALRSDATYWEATITTSRARRKPRVLRFRGWDDRVNRRVFIRILEPAGSAGTGFLKLEPNSWKFAPRGEGAQRIAPSVMLHRWMNSDFAKDDLLHASSPVDDYRHRLLGIETLEDAGGLRGHRVEYLPRPDAPVAWGRIEAWLEVQHGTPLRVDCFDASGEKLRELRFDDIREVQSRHFPHRWTLRRLDEKARESVLEVQEIRFDQAFEDGIFTPRHLLQSR